MKRKAGREMEGSNGVEDSLSPGSLPLHETGYAQYSIPLCRMAETMRITVSSFPSDVFTTGGRRPRMAFV